MIGKGPTWIADRDARSLEHFEVLVPQAVRCYHLDFRCPGEEMPAHLLCAASPEPDDESTIGLLLIRLARMSEGSSGVCRPFSIKRRMQSALTKPHKISHAILRSI